MPCSLLHNVYMYGYILGKEKAFFVALSVLDQVIVLFTLVLEFAQSQVSCWV